MTKLIALAAGGTGGHLFPAEALARDLLARGFRVALITDRRGHAFGDPRVTPGSQSGGGESGVDLYRIRAGRLDAGLGGKLMGVAEIALGTFEAQRLLRKLAPACVVGFGGYPSVPTMLAAARLRLPTVIHEQNAMLGRANRLLTPRIGHIATSFAETKGLRAEDKARVTVTGNPVRPAVAAQRDIVYTTPEPDRPFRILIIGGSQGARILSQVVPRAIALLPDAVKRRLQVAQQARPEDLDTVRELYAEAGLAAELASFFDDVPQRMAAAHLVISRAGASSVAELAAIGRPAILVPYAHAAEDHQNLNACAFATPGAAWILREAEFTPETLAQKLAALMQAPQELRAAAAAALVQGKPLAGQALADLVAHIAGGANGDAARKDAA